MQEIGKTEFMRRIMAQIAEEDRIHGTPDERAYDYVRSIFPEAQPYELMSSPGDYLCAQRDAKCTENCQGVTRCPQSRAIHVVRREHRGNELAYVVYSTACPEGMSQQRAIQTDKLIAASRIPAKMREYTFESYRTAPPLDKVLRAAKGIAMASVDDGSGLLLGGPPGIGKTHLAVAITQAHVERGRHAIFTPVITLLDEMRAHVADGKADEIMREVCEADCLALDDLGVERTSDWVGERLYELFDTRYRCQRQTIVTTNATSMRELAAMIGEQGERIASRLTERAHPMFFKAQDFRQRRIKQESLGVAS